MTKTMRQNNLCLQFLIFVSPTFPRHRTMQCICTLNAGLKLRPQTGMRYSLEATATLLGIPRCQCLFHLFPFSKKHHQSKPPFSPPLNPISSSFPSYPPPPPLILTPISLPFTRPPRGTRLVHLFTSSVHLRKAIRFLPVANLHSFVTHRGSVVGFFLDFLRLRARPYISWSDHSPHYDHAAIRYITCSDHSPHYE